MFFYCPLARNVCRLTAVMLFFGCICSETLFAQKAEFNFDSAGTLSSFPLNRAFEKSTGRITIDLKKPTGRYLQQVHDSLSAKASRMKTFLLTKETVDFYRWLFSDDLYDSTDNGSFFSAFKQWQAYLESSASADAPAGGWFPMLPTANQMKDSAWWVYSHNNKVKKRWVAGEALEIGAGSPWVKAGYHNEVQFKVVMKDVWRESIIDEYNRSLTDAVRKLNSDTLLAWKAQLDTLLLRARQLGKMLRDTSIKFASTCFVDSIRRWEEDTLEKTPLVTFLRANKNFFLSWLWLNEGQLTLDPFGFTAPGKLPKTLSRPDAINRARALMFDTLYRKLYDEKEIVKIYKDTLTIRDIVRQQYRGKDYFKSEDSLAALQRNSDQLKQFQALRQNIYSFSFPYRVPDDSTIAFQQFDAAANFKRVDRLSDGSDQPVALRAILSKIPDQWMAMLVVHNVPSTTKVTVTEATTAITDQSAFQKALNDSAFSGIAALAGVFTSSTFLNLYSFIPTQPVIATKVLVPPATPVPVQGGRSYYYQSRGQVANCTDTLKARLTRAFQDTVTKYHVHCADEFIQDEVEAIAGRNTANCQTVLNPSNWHLFLIRSLQEFINALNVRIGQVNILRSQYADSISRDTLVAIANLASIGQYVAPPDKLTADNTSLADSSVFASQTKYLQQASSLNRDSYTIYTAGTKGKDTVPTAVAGGQFSKAPRHLFALGVGVEYTFGKVPLNTVTTSGGQLSISQDTQAERLVVGVHIYPGKLFNLDNRFFIHRPYDGSLHYGVSTWSRLSVFLGMGIPDPLHNYYTGISADLLPGLKLNTGPQWLWYTKYQILNNAIADQQSALRYGGWYVALNIDPAGLITTLIGQFK